MGSFYLDTVSCQEWRMITVLVGARIPYKIGIWMVHSCWVQVRNIWKTNYLLAEVILYITFGFQMDSEFECSVFEPHTVYSWGAHTNVWIPYWGIEDSNHGEWSHLTTCIGKRNSPIKRNCNVNHITLCVKKWPTKFKRSVADINKIVVTSCPPFWMQCLRMISWWLGSMLQMRAVESPEPEASKSSRGFQAQMKTSESWPFSTQA